MNTPQSLQCSWARWL